MERERRGKENWNRKAGVRKGKGVGKGKGERKRNKGNKGGEEKGEATVGVFTCN